MIKLLIFLKTINTQEKESFIIKKKILEEKIVTNNNKKQQIISNLRIEFKKNIEQNDIQNIEPYKRYWNNVILTLEQENKAIFQEIMILIKKIIEHRLKEKQMINLIDQYKEKKKIVEEERDNEVIEEINIINNQIISCDN